ncbi:MAG TPA: sulfatase-like hydrolase/transferase [Planctomycetota bacterium]
MAQTGSKTPRNASPAPAGSLPTRRFAVVFLALVLAAAAFGTWKQFQTPARGEKAGIRNLLLVTFDTTRADRIGAYGHVAARTDNLDRLAAEGVLFERAIAPAPITLPSHTSILTGLYPIHHGARNNGTHHVEPEIETLAEMLSKEGFATGAVVSALVLDSRYGLDQDFDHYDDDLSKAKKAPLFLYRETKTDVTSERAIRWIQDRGSERFFLWVHFFDPHANYDPPAELAAQVQIAYDGEIFHADRGLGNILEALRLRHLLAETLVVMTADHGESLGEHGEMTHSMFVYDATTWVPMIQSHPALAQGKRVRGTVSPVDLVPTTLELLGLRVPKNLDGVSQATVCLDEAAQAGPREVYSESMNPYYNHGWSDTRAVTDDAWRYIRAPEPELYDLFRDRRELNNLHDAQPAQVATMTVALEDFLRAGERNIRGDTMRSMDPETREQLAALGYVWTEHEEAEAGAALPDPKNKIAYWERSQAAHELVRKQEFEAAEVALKKVLEEDPHADITQSALVSVLMERGKEDEALDLLRKMAAEPVPSVTNLLRLANLDASQGSRPGPSTWTVPRGSRRATRSPGCEWATGRRTKSGPKTPSPPTKRRWRSTRSARRPCSGWATPTTAPAARARPKRCCARPASSTRWHSKRKRTTTLAWCSKPRNGPPRPRPGTAKRWCSSPSTCSRSPISATCSAAPSVRRKPKPPTASRSRPTLRTSTRASTSACSTCAPATRRRPPPNSRSLGRSTPSAGLPRAIC